MFMATQLWEHRVVALQPTAIGTTGCIAIQLWKHKVVALEPTAIGTTGCVHGYTAVGT